MFDKIVTVTLNPSIDATYWLDSLDFVEPVGCEIQKNYPGGKGLNVSRVLTSLGVDNVAVGITGRENKLKLSGLLDKENVCYHFVENEGSVRENLSIIFPDAKMLKINCRGFFVSPQILDEVMSEITRVIGESKLPLLVFAGSLPRNVDMESYKKMVMTFKKKGALIVLDNDIFSVSDLAEISPFLIKPNHVELAHMFGKEKISEDSIKDYAMQLAKVSEHVLVSLSKDGLLYCNKNESINATVPKVTAKSTIGAGDTTLAGFITSLSRQYSISDCVRFAAACGTASVMLEGTQTIVPQEAESVYENVILC